MEAVPVLSGKRVPANIRDAVLLAVGILAGGVLAELTGKDSMGFALLLAVAVVSWPLAGLGLRWCAAHRRRRDGRSDGSAV